MAVSQASESVAVTQRLAQLCYELRESRGALIEMATGQASRINPYRLQVYPRRELWQRIKDIAAERGESTSTVVNDLLERALFTDEAAKVVSVLEPQIQSLRDDLAFVLGRLFLTEALADRAVLASSAAYECARVALEDRIGAERFDALKADLSDSANAVYQRQKAEAMRMAQATADGFTGGGNGDQE